MIEWREGMSVGNAVIDADHKRLIAIINRFEKGGGEIADAVLIELMNYADAHFMREEIILRNCRFPFLDAHHKSHQRMVGELTALLESWEVTPRADQALKIDEIANFLRYWLVDHILKEDLPMKPYVLKAIVTPG